MDAVQENHGGRVEHLLTAWLAHAYARYRMVVAMERLVVSSDPGRRSRAAKWALAWGIVAQLWPVEDELGPAPLRRVSLNVHTRKLGAD